MSFTYLAFQGCVSHTICAFNQQSELTKFVRWMIDCHHSILTINPSLKPIPTFDTAEEAIKYFEK